MVEEVKRVALGIITHRRLDGLRRLLESLAKINVPEAVTCTVLLVENDAEGMVEGALEELRARVPFDIEFALEPTPGIPFARNRVLDMAIEGGFDFLTFVDDDQKVHEDWLLMLYATMTMRRLDLVGGPRTLVPEDGAALSWGDRLALNHWQAEMIRLMNNKSKMAFTDDEAGIPIYTSNWMLRLSAQQALGIRFDENYQFTGGSDTKFHMDLSNAGGKSGWASDARAYEIWPKERLTLNYLYRRVRDQKITNLTRTDKQTTKARAARKLVANAYFAFGLLLRAPFNRFRTLPSAIRKLADGAAEFRAATGVKSTLYERKN
ncbi:MAG: glycosyltransferase family 2 protein [Pseudomonadota bacterium]